MPLRALKLGGSLITDKAAASPTARPDAIERATAEAVAGGARVVVHGAGSFGHPLARAGGFSTTPSEGNPADAHRVRDAVRELNAMVVAGLDAAGATVVVVDAAKLFMFDGERITPRPVDEVPTPVGAGRVAVSFGDLLKHGSGRYVVVSGDDVLLQLVRVWAGRLAIFATDVDGILTGPPGTPGATLIERADDVPPGIAGGAAADITGGMGRKLATLRALPPGCSGGIINGTVPGRIEAALEAPWTVPGTWTRPGADPAGAK